MKIHDCFLSFFREQESAVFGVIHKEVFGEDCGAEGVAEDVEVSFEVGGSVCAVRSDFVTGQVFLGSFVKAGGELVRLGISFCGVCAPTSGCHPLYAVSGGVDVDGNQNYIVLAIWPAYVVYTPASFRKRDVCVFGNYECCVISEVL